MRDIAARLRENDLRQTHTRFPRPIDYGPEEYIDEIKRVCYGFQESLKEMLLRSVGTEVEGIALATTGSDGRLEKGPVSQIEFMLFLANGQEQTQEFERIMRLVNGIPADIADQLVEKKNYSDRMNFYSGSDDRDTEMFSPMRTLDARLLGGDSYLLERSKVKLIEEWQGASGKKLLKRTKDRLKEKERTTQTGSQKYGNKVLVHFDPKEGIASYDPTAGLRSFKEGPLRLLQWSITYNLMKYARKNGVSRSRWILNIPSNTCERIAKLGDLDNEMSLMQQIDLIAGYNWLLRNYHKSQDNWHNENNSMISFDKNVYAEIASDIIRILSKPLIRY